MSDLLIVSRRQWGARFSAGSRRLPPVSTVVVHHTVTRPTGDPCRDMRTIERVLHSRRLAPGYNAVIHPSGVILEGAGPNIGAHTAGQNSRTYGISFMGNFEGESPTWDALAAAGKLINLLRWIGQLPPELDRVRIAGHNEFRSTACPGANLRPRLQQIRWFAGLG